MQMLPGSLACTLPFTTQTCTVTRSTRGLPPSWAPSPPPLQAALAKGLVSDAELEQAVDLLHNPRAGIDGGLDLAELLYDQQTAQLISTPVQVVAFSDEEGVR